MSLKRKKKLQFKKTISSIMFHICFWANPSRDQLFEILKIIQNYDQKSRFQGMFWRAHKTATLTSFQRTGDKQSNEHLVSKNTIPVIGSFSLSKVTVFLNYFMNHQFLAISRDLFPLKWRFLKTDFVCKHSVLGNVLRHVSIILL